MLVTSIPSLEMLDGSTLTDLDRDLAAHEIPDPHLTSEQPQASDNSTDTHPPSHYNNGNNPSNQIPAEEATKNSATSPQNRSHSCRGNVLASDLVTHPATQAQITQSRSQIHPHQHQRTHPGATDQDKTAAVGEDSACTPIHPAKVQAANVDTLQPSAQRPTSSSSSNPRLRTPTTIDHPSPSHSAAMRKSQSVSTSKRPATASGLRASCQLFSEGNSSLNEHPLLLEYLVRQVLADGSSSLATGAAMNGAQHATSTSQVCGLFQQHDTVRNAQSSLTLLAPVYLRGL